MFSVASLSPVFSPPNLLAIGFAAPMLAGAGLLLAGIPIILHILNRRRYKVHRWAAMVYLMEALRRNRRRMKFEQWILMAIRCCVLILAGLALARPMGCSPSSGGTLLGQSSHLNIIVIDNSASMAWQSARPDTRTNMERAKKLASELTQRLAGSHDAVCVITTAGGSGGQLLLPTFDIDAAGQVIRQVPQRFTPSDLPGALNTALDIAQKSTGFTGKRLYLITDSTRPAWQGENVAQSIRELGPRLAQTFAVTHVNVGETSQVNSAITDLRLLGNIVTSNMPADLVCRPKSFGGASTVNLQWQSGFKVLQSRAGLRLDPDTPDQTLPQVALTDEGPAAVTVRLEPADRLPEDDERGLSLIVRRQLNVLVAEGERGSGPLQSPGAFVQLALAPASDAQQSKAGAAHVELGAELDLPNQVLGGFDAVILAGAGRPNAAEARQLKSYVASGGTLVIFMGEGANLESYNQTLLAEGLLPGRLVSLATLAEGQEPFRFDFKPDASLHPLLRIFRGEQQSGLGSTRVFTYVRVQVGPQANVQRVLDMAGGDPAITLHALGKGKIIFFATSADTRWTTLPAKPAFVALLNEILLGSIDADNAWMNCPAGSRLQVPRRIVERQEVRFADPAGHPVLLNPADAGHPDLAYLSEPMERPGMYRLQVDGKTYPIAVRFPASESDVTVLDPAAIRKALGDILLDQENDRIPQTISAKSDQADFGWPIMLAVLILIGAECFLAMWFRR